MNSYSLHIVHRIIANLLALSTCEAIVVVQEPSAKDELNVVVPEGAEDETIVVQKGTECE